MRARLLASLALAACCSCAPEAGLVINLAYVPGDEPFRDVVELELTAALDGEVLAQERRTLVGAGTDGDPLFMDAVPRRAGIEVRLEGRDAGGATVAEGLARPEVPPPGGSCCVWLCFCSAALFASDACGCGSDACTDDCLST